MNKKLLIVIFIVLSLVAGCTSLPTPSSSEDTLGVFYLINEIESQYTGDGYLIPINYHFIISSMNTNEEVKVVELPYNADFALIKNLDAGAYYVSAFYSQLESGEKGEPYPLNKEYCQFTLNPGQLTVVPKAFGTVVFEDGGDTYFKIQAYDLPPELVRSVTVSLLEDKYPEEMAVWTIAE
ncbi:MAG: hypothetical protein PQJ59_01325 [Spirochaetales bacterium]|nr:hypothetical protein [Spirochaetales bacterium]